MASPHPILGAIPGFWAVAFCRAGSAGCSSRCVLSCCRIQAQLLGIPAGMDQKDIYAVKWWPCSLLGPGRRHFFRAADADPHGPVCSADHGDSTVAADFGGRCSCCQVVQILRCCRGEALGAPTVAACREICGFLRPFVFGSHLFGVRLRSTGFWTFLGDDFRIFPVFSTFWFNIGYMHCVSLRSLLHVKWTLGDDFWFVSVFCA